MDQKVILIVCDGNIHRSVIAECCLNRALEVKGLNDKFVVVSRGLQGTLGTIAPKGKNLCDYPLEWSFSAPVLSKLNIDISVHCTTPVDISIIKKASLVLAMDRSTLIDKLNSLINQFPQHAYKMRLFRELEGKPEDVPDCAGSSDPALHRRVIELVSLISEKYIDILLAYVQLFILEKQKGE